MFENREAWLASFALEVKPWFDQAGYRLPVNGDGLNIRFSCGWPAGSRGGKGRIGECWTRKASNDDHFEIFVSPVLDDPVKVASTCLHELIHAAVGVDCGHMGNFKKLALILGFQKPMRSTPATPELRERLNVVTKILGQYPHAKLSPGDGRKRDKARLIKVKCSKCGYTVRLTRKWLDVGAPYCPCGEKMREPEVN